MLSAPSSRLTYITRPAAARARYEADGWTVVLETQIRPEWAVDNTGARWQTRSLIEAVVLCRRVVDEEAA